MKIDIIFVHSHAHMQRAVFKRATSVDANFMIDNMLRNKQQADDAGCVVKFRYFIAIGMHKCGAATHGMLYINQLVIGILMRLRAFSLGSQSATKLA